jgi:signal transduction histidine kinase
VKVFSRFPARLAALFLVLIAIMGVASVLIALRIFERRQVEIDQRLNTGVAASMAAEIQPYIVVSGTGDEVGSIMHYMMVLNPAVEIYLLDGDGAILDYFTSPGPPVVLERVDVRPIQAYLNEERQLPILGDNPRRPDLRHHFSAAPISLGDGRTGYLYVILRSSGYNEAEMDLQQRYLLQALRTSIFITIPLVGILGLLVFFLATRPLQRLAQTVRTFGSGDYRARSGIDGRDEFGDLARSFNAMADTIVENVEHLEGADRERRELIANISHDIRNPLATIQGYLETLSEKDAVLSAADRNRYYEILLSTAGSLPRLVEDLFELSKLENPGVRPGMEPLSLSELVQDVVMQWSGRAADQEVTLSAREPTGLHLVNGNVGLIERVLTNLIRNALTHTSAGGRVTVSLSDGDHAVRVEVADTGVGISVADQQRIFERFYIGDASRTRSRDGSGLGLAICKRIVELHGGHIDVRSTPGEGSTFFFDIPISGGAMSGS